MKVLEKNICLETIPQTITAKPSKWQGVNKQLSSAHWDINTLKGYRKRAT
jgi:hypothetical protein